MELAEQNDLDETAAYALCGLGGAYRASGHYDKSLQFYQQANERMRARADRFGTAYSYCGVGNALRMAGQLDASESFFQQAADLYRAIGDIVSYAYTLWSWATLHKCQRQLDSAQAKFDKAAALFARSGDRRGAIYARLGLAELAQLRGKGDPGQLQALIRDAERLQLGLETAYARLLEALVRADPAAVAHANAGLRSLGSLFQAQSLPLNLP